MSFSPNTPTLARGGLVTVELAGGRVLRVIPLQYNPDTVTRTLQPQGIGPEPGDRLEALRLKSAAHQTIKFEAELDAIDQLEHPDDNPTVAENGLHPALAALELLIQPSSADLALIDRLASQGSIEVAPVEAPLTVLVLGRRRVVPVRITDMSITEEAYDSLLNPIRARVSLGLRVLTTDDVGFDHRGGALYLLHHREQERLRGLAASAPLSVTGLRTLPGA